MFLQPKKLLLIGLSIALMGILPAGCQEKGPAEKAGEKIDQTLEEAGDKIEEAGDKVKQATD